MHPGKYDSESVGQLILKYDSESVRHGVVEYSGCTIQDQINGEVDKLY